MIYLISLKNELSGSCVSIKNLSNLLTTNLIKNKIISSKGLFLNTSEKKLIDTSFGIFSIIKNIRTLREGNFEPDSLVIFNTILQLPYYLFVKHQNKLLYIHEQNLRPQWLYHFINFIINKFKVKVAVVNPKMLNLYINSVLLPNVLEEIKVNSSVKNKKKQILMISNCNLNKGIDDFIKLAINYKDYNFILLTNKYLGKNDCLDSIIKNEHIYNFKIVYDQNLKKELLKESLILISLSYYNETFGLVLYEALAEGTIPISTENDGSLYCLNENKFLVHSRESLECDFNRIVNDIINNYDEIFDELKKYINKQFAKKNILQIINKLYEGEI